MITQQLQPTPNSCGQTCVAMLLGMPVAEVLALIPDSGQGTTSGQIAVHLILLGWRVVKPVRFRRSLPALCLARIVWPGPGSARRRGHWVLFAEGRCFDPADAHQWAWVAHGGRLVSIMALAPPDRCLP